MPDLLPDPLEVLRLYLVRADSPLRQYVANRVGVTLTGGEPAIRLTENGGTVGQGEGQPVVLVECWGRSNVPDDGTASRIARELAADVEGTRMRGWWADGFCAGAAVDGGISDSPDPTTRRPRKLLTVRLVTTPL
jgi:hypothetical protein